MQESLVPIFTLTQLKYSAKQIRSYLDSIGIKLSHSTALDVASNGIGYANYNIAKASIEKREALHKEGVYQIIVPAFPNPSKGIRIDQSNNTNMHYFSTPESIDVEMWMEIQRERRSVQSDMRKMRAKSLESESGTALLRKLSITSEDIENIPERIYVGGDSVNIVFDKNNDVVDYEIEIDTIRSEKELLSMIKHLSGKMWMSEEILFEFMMKAGVV